MVLALSPAINQRRASAGDHPHRECARRAAPLDEREWAYWMTAKERERENDDPRIDYIGTSTSDCRGEQSSFTLLPQSHTSTQQRADTYIKRERRRDCREIAAMKCMWVHVMCHPAQHHPSAPFFSWPGHKIETSQPSVISHCIYKVVGLDATIQEIDPMNDDDHHSCTTVAKHNNKWIKSPNRQSCNNLGGDHFIGINKMLMAVATSGSGGLGASQRGNGQTRTGNPFSFHPLHFTGWLLNPSSAINYAIR